MSLVGRFEHLPKRPRSDEARPLLEKIASQVRPIMAKRGWKVGTLAEFLPANPALLGNNMNHGERINLRLRPPGDTTNFYDYDQLVLVMLHELTHIEHGPHDASFYRLLAVLEEEYYELKRRGFSGDGFHSAGHVVNGLRVSEYEGRRVGLAAAEKRLAQARVIGKGGVLGGAARGGKTMREVVAEAAERRTRDDKACHTQDAGHAAEAEAEVRRAQAESEGVDAADLERERGGVPATEAGAGADAGARAGGDSLAALGESSGGSSSAAPPSAATAAARRPRATETRPAKLGKVAPAPPGSASSKPGPARAERTEPSRARPTPPAPAESSDWACPTCTLLNAPHALACDACAAPRPAGLGGRRAGPAGGAAWWCDFCGAGPRDAAFWSCAECGWVRKWG